jgi:hypothetical protein
MNTIWAKRIAVWVLLVLIVGMGADTVYRSGPYRWGGTTWGSKAHRCDLTVFLAAGRAVLDGTDIYEAHNVRGWYYLQPPIFAIVMVPFAMMPQIWAVAVWYVLSVAVTIASVRMCVWMIAEREPPTRRQFVLYVAPPLLVIWLIVSALGHGQSSALMLWLVIAALYCNQRGREVVGGASLAGAALVKVFPVLLLAYFLWRKKWRFVAASLLALALGLFVLPSVVFGWNGNRVFLKKWVARVVAPSLQGENERGNAPLYNTFLNADMVNNQSLPAVLWRWTRIRGAAWIARLALAAMALVIFWVGRKSSPVTEPLILGAAVVCAVLAPPVSWSHYFQVLLFPLTALIALTQRTDDQWLRNFIYVCLTIYGVLCVVASSRPLLGLGSLCVGTIAVWGALIVAATRCNTAALKSPGATPNG